MFIITSGRPNKVSLKLCKEAVNFYGKILLGESLSKKVEINLKFCKGENLFGYCEWEDDNCKPREFTVGIDKNLSKKATLMAIAHEMVHVKQFAKGECKDLYRPAKLTRWKDEYYDTDEIDYWDFPWEIEAYGREIGLYLKFINYCKLNH